MAAATSELLLLYFFKNVDCSERDFVYMQAYADIGYEAQALEHCRWCVVHPFFLLGQLIMLKCNLLVEGG